MNTTVKVFSNEGLKTFEDVPMTESDIWKKVGSALLEVAIPNTLTVETACGDATVRVIKRGTYVEKGERKPSMHCVIENNCIDVPKGDYQEAYLTCVHPESNNYKFYWIKPDNATHKIGAQYGRIGSDRGDAFGTKDLKVPYESEYYWILYYEKLSKGYKDQSDVYLHSETTVSEPEVEEEETSEPVNMASKELYDLLMSFAKHTIQEMVRDPQRITQKQVEKSRKIWEKLGSYVQVAAFNRHLQELLVLVPRKTRNVNSLLAVTKEDFADILEREESLINAMEAVLTGNPYKVKVKKAETFDALGIDVFEATDEQKQEVMNKISDLVKPKVKKIYRVIPKEQKEKFNTYLKEKNISVVKQLWHGSRNENWFSIVKNSLMINPNANVIRTGSMLGHGIYLAPSSAKSIGYASVNGSYWANGHSHTGILGLYAVAYGKAYDATNDIRQYTKSELDRGGYNCVHARGGTGLYLRNDEVVVFDSDAVLLNYIVVLEG